MARYRQLPVPYYPSPGVRTQVVADVHKYVNERLARSGRGANLAYLNRLLTFMREERRRPSGRLPFQFNWADRLKFRPTFYGVGSPESCSMTLQYALVIGRPGTIRDLFLPQTDPSRLAHYCDVDPKVGVDCVGFVSNYLRAISHRPAYLREQRGVPNLAGLDDWYQVRPRRRDFNNVQPLDVLYWRNASGGDANMRHIAIIESVQAQNGQMLVVESSGSFNGGGLHAGTYEIRGNRTPANGVFQVYRGADCSSQGLSHVTIHEP